MTDEELERYADTHWVSIVYCFECKHMHNGNTCSKLGIPVSSTFWCGYGEKKENEYLRT